MTNSKFIISILFAAIFMIIGCSDQAEPTQKETITNREPVKVQTETVGSLSKNSNASLSGLIQSEDKAIVSARMMGYITDLKAKIGDRVAKGQIIIRIKNDELIAQKAQVNAGIREARASLSNVEVNYNRLKALWDQESITKKEWDDVSTQYQVVQAKVEAAEQKLNEINEVISHNTVKAPIAGLITEKMIHKGDLVNPGIPLMTIESEKGYEVATYVSDHQISALQLGMSVDCQIKAINQTFKAKITEISPSAVNTAGQFTVKAALQLSEEDKKSVYPGMYANVIADIPQYVQKQSCAIVQKSALVTRGQLTGIYTISNQNTALLRWIRVGKDFGDRVEIVSGLSAGEEYIIGDLANISDGLPVTK